MKAIQKLTNAVKKNEQEARNLLRVIAEAERKPAFHANRPRPLTGF